MEFTIIDILIETIWILYLHIEILNFPLQTELEIYCFRTIYYFSTLHYMYTM